MQPPAHLADDVRAIWAEVLEHLPAGRKVDPIRFEVYCEQLLAFRVAAADVRENGVSIEDAQGRTIRNPSIDALTAMTKQLNTWGAEFAPPSSMPKRRRGSMYDATRRSVAAAEHLKNAPQYEGAIEAVCTLAWLIDEAQRAGLHALQQAAFGTIPSYLKGCANLQITPAEAPTAGEAKKPGAKPGGRRSSMRVLSATG